MHPYNCFICLSGRAPLPSSFLSISLSPNPFSSLFSSSLPPPHCLYNLKRNTFVSQNLNKIEVNKVKRENPSPPHLLTNPNLNIPIVWFVYFNFFLHIFQTSPYTMHSYCFSPYWTDQTSLHFCEHGCLCERWHVILNNSPGFLWLT